MAKTIPVGFDVEASAVISSCGLYRYSLRRIWPETDLQGGKLVVIMLNPSTADGTQDDPTIAKLTKYARAWHYNELVVVNLFALRATDPTEMLRYWNPVGPGNNAAILEQLQDAHGIVCAWGAHGGHMGRDKAVIKLLLEFLEVEPGRGPLQVLRLTKGGQPYHPLYLPGDLFPVKWEEVYA